MLKRNSKGFTLLELLIAMAIFITVIFIGYRLLNKTNIDIRNQGNINKGQLTVNDMNEYLTKDLEQARSIALYLNGQEIANTKQDTTEAENNEDDNTQQDILKKYISDLESKLLANCDFDYSYNIKFKDESTQTNESTVHDVTYKVSITDKNENNYKYTVVRIDETNGVSITFTNDETVTKKKNEAFELPFTIEGNGIYKVNLGYNGKNNNFEIYEFTISSRLSELSQSGNDGGTVTGGTVTGNIVYIWKKGNNNYNVKAYSTVGDDKRERNETQYNNSRDMSIQIDRGSNPAIIRSRGLDSEIATSDLKFKEIKYISLKVEGKLVLSDIKFNGKDMGSLDFSNASIVLNLEKMSDSIEANFNFKNMKENGDWGNLIINLIY